jgi:Domain of unknown function (DUF4440)
VKNVRQLVVVAALVFPSVMQGQVAGEPLVRQLTELKNQLLKAERERNADFLEQVFADEFVYGMTQGDVLSKAQLLARVKSPGHKYEELHSDGEKVLVYGNVAIMTDHTTARGSNEDHPFGGTFRFVRVFVKKHGKWQVVLEQGTPMLQQSIPAK